jgi:hypothetical protein
LNNSLGTVRTCLAHFFPKPIAGKGDRTFDASLAALARRQENDIVDVTAKPLTLLQRRGQVG